MSGNHDHDVTVEVKLPWHTLAEFILEEGACFADVDSRPDYAHAPTVWKSLQFLRDTNEDSEKGESEELRRVFTAAGILISLFPNRSISDCFDQAVVWERG